MYVSKVSPAKFFILFRNVINPRRMLIFWKGLVQCPLNFIYGYSNNVCNVDVYGKEFKVLYRLCYGGGGLPLLVQCAYNTIGKVIMYR